MITPSYTTNPPATNITYHEHPCRFISKCGFSRPDSPICNNNVAEHYFPDKPATCYSKMLEAEKEERKERRIKFLSGLLKFLNLN